MRSFVSDNQVHYSSSNKAHKRIQPYVRIAELGLILDIYSGGCGEVDGREPTQGTQDALTTFPIPIGPRDAKVLRKMLWSFFFCLGL